MSRWLSIVVAVAMLAVGCSERPVGAVMTDTPRDLWQMGESVSVVYENSDTLTRHTLGVVVRQEASRMEGAITLLVRCISPSGVSFESPVVVPAEERHSGGSFAESAGEWVNDARFEEQGEYTFTLTPTSDLRGVWMAGVELKVAEAKR